MSCIKDYFTKLKRLGYIQEWMEQQEKILIAGHEYKKEEVLTGLQNFSFAETSELYNYLFHYPNKKSEARKLTDSVNEIFNINFSA